MGVPSFSASLRHFLFPTSCAVCGRTLLGGAEADEGVCAACAEKLRPAAGIRCARCGRPLISERVVCMECRDTPPRSFDGAHLLFPYAGRARRFFIAFKFGACRGAAGFAARSIAEALAARAADIGPDASIVPVPPRPGKLKRGAWDQVEAIVSRMEKREGACVSRCLARLPCKTQKTLNRSERVENMRSAFVCVRPPPRRAVLVDDVYTTGATLNACAAALKRSGSVFVFVVALCYD